MIDEGHKRAAICPLLSSWYKKVVCDAGYPVTERQLRKGVRKHICALWQSQIQYNEERTKIGEYRNCAINLIYKNGLDLLSIENVQTGLINNIRNQRGINDSLRSLPTGDERPLGEIESSKVSGLES